MTLEELRAQKAEIDKQIRAFKDIPAKTENFEVERQSGKKLLLKYGLKNTKKRALVCVHDFDKRGKETLDNDLCEVLDFLICQLQSLKEQMQS